MGSKQEIDDALLDYHVTKIDGQDMKYVTLSHNGAPLVIWTNPGLYPTTVDANDVVVRTKQVGEG